MATVLVPTTLSESDRAAIGDVIEIVSDHDIDHVPNPSGFWVCNNRPIGGAYLGEGRHFAIEFGLQPCWEPSELEAVAESFGVAPRDELAVIAFSNSSEDHLVLGELCVWLAERFGGIVCFGGALWPGLPPDLQIDILDLDWRQLEPHFRRMVANMTGRIVGLQYERKPGRDWVNHLADVNFLRAWMAHPRFRMVK